MKEEDMKKCKRVKICEANIEGCGFCESKGYAVPVHESGKLKYEMDEDGGCSEPIMMKGKCIIRRIAEDGVRRIDENGNLVSSGVGRRTDEQTVCTPINGKLSRNCLRFLALSRGLGSNGGILKMINSGSSPSQADKVAIDILGKNNIVLLTNAIIS